MGLREWEVQLHTLYDPSHVYKGEEEDGKEKKDFKEELRNQTEGQTPTFGRRVK